MKHLISLLASIAFMVTAVGAQDLYRTGRSLEVQQAISHIGQAEYYARMALISLDASEKAGRAPFFDYKRAREDLERISKEFRTYLGAEGSPARAAAIPLVIDGRYFLESIKDYLREERPSESGGAVSVLPAPLQKQEPVVTESPSESAPTPGEKESEVEEPKQEEQSALSPPVKPLKLPNDQSKRDKIEEILKKGL